MVFTSFATAKVGKWVMSKLTFRNIAILVGILFTLWLLWTVYGKIIERGMAKQREIDAPKIAALEEDRDKWKGKYESYRTSFKTWVYRSELARLNLAKQNEALVAGLEQRLSDAKKRQKATRGLVHEIPRYVPATVDVDLPVGFVRLYNVSIEGESPAGSPEQNGISESVTLDVGAPSGVTLSTFAGYAVENNAECVFRGEVIRAWQEWYPKTKEQFDRVQQEAADAIPRVPMDAPDQPPAPPQPTSDAGTSVSPPLALNENTSHDTTTNIWSGNSDRYTIRNPQATWYRQPDSPSR